jgi:hypothetical protein
MGKIEEWIAALMNSNAVLEETDVICPVKRRSVREVEISRAA